MRRTQDHVVLSSPLFTQIYHACTCRCRAAHYLHQFVPLSSRDPYTNDHDQERAKGGRGRLGGGDEMDYMVICNPLRTCQPCKLWDDM